MSDRREAHPVDGIQSTKPTSRRWLTFRLTIGVAPLLFLVTIPLAFRLWSRFFNTFPPITTLLLIALVLSLLLASVIVSPVMWRFGDKLQARWDRARDPMRDRFWWVAFSAIGGGIWIGHPQVSFMSQTMFDSIVAGITVAGVTGLACERVPWWVLTAAGVALWAAPLVALLFDVALDPKISQHGMAMVVGALGYRTQRKRWLEVSSSSASGVTP